MDQVVIITGICLGLASFCVVAITTVTVRYFRAKTRVTGKPYRDLVYYARRSDTAIIRLINEWEAHPASAELTPEDVRNLIYELHANFPKGV